MPLFNPHKGKCLTIFTLFLTPELVINFDSGIQIWVSLIQNHTASKSQKD